MARLDRRRFLQAAAGAALGLAGCKGSAPAAGEFAGRTLTVFVYSGLDAIYQEHFADPFQARTGATVALEAGWWDSIAKLKTSPPGRPAFDLVLTDATQGYPAIKDGLFRQIDFANVPNVRQLAPSVLDNQVARDRYGVTFPESAHTLIYDRRRIGAVPTGWGDLLRDDLRGRLGFYNSFYLSLYTFACMKVAGEGRPGTASRAIADDIGAVLDFAKRERRRVGVWWPTGTKMLQDLGQGAFTAGNAHSVSLLSTLAENAATMGFLAPEPDRAFVQLMWVVPADTPNADMAEAAIDALLSQEVQVAVARRGAGVPHQEAARIVAAESPDWARACPSTPEQFRAIRYYPYEEYFKDWERIARVWEEEVLRGA